MIAVIIDTDEYIDAVTAAEILGVSRSAVSFQCKAGRFPGLVRIGHFWLIPRKAVENYTRLKPGPKKKGGCEA